MTHLAGRPSDWVTGGGAKLSDSASALMTWLERACLSACFVASPVMNRLNCLVAPIAR